MLFRSLALIIKGQAKELPINEHPHERQTLCIGAFGPEEDFFTLDELCRDNPEQTETE